ncbi:MAG: signal peptidase II [Acidobacteriia bacterium]|nr:signal peptidase II [Terriglobia bacterium]
MTLQEAPTRSAGRVRSARAAYLVLLSAAAIIIGLDQWTKQLALDGLADSSTVRLLGGLIYLDLAFNSGAAFSFGTGFAWIFTIIAIVISAGILWFTRQVRSWPWALALGLIMGGAQGNLVDRLFREPGPFRGHVVDFISVFAPAGERFPIFNIADSALTVGVVLAIALELLAFRRDGTRVVDQRPSGDA